MKFLYLVLVPLAIAAPLANQERDTGVHAVAVRDADAAPAIVDDVEARAHIAGLDVDALMAQVQSSLGQIQGLTQDAVKSLTDVIKSVLDGNPLSPSSLKTLARLPRQLITQIVDVLTPILVPATAGFPGVNVVIHTLLAALRALGWGLGGLFNWHKRQLDGVDVDAVIADLTNGLKAVPGMDNDAIQALVSLVKALALGLPIDTGALDKLKSLGSDGLAGIIGVLNSIIAKVPVLGQLLSPLLALLQLGLAIGGTLPGL